MCNALSTYLDHDNACSVFAAADSYQCQGLKMEAFSKIVQHFALTARSEGWVALTKGQLSEVSCHLRYIGIWLRFCPARSHQVFIPAYIRIPCSPVHIVHFLLSRMFSSCVLSFLFSRSHSPFPVCPRGHMIISSSPVLFFRVCCPVCSL